MSDGSANNSLAASTMPAAPRRAHLVGAGFLLTLFVIYGSFVPLEFRALSWNTAVEQFKQTPLFEISFARGADWVAHFVLFLLLGFIWLGVLDVDRRSRSVGLVMFPFVFAALAALAVGLEFAQQWTVQRTSSESDLFADLLGAGVGCMFWLIAGRRFVQFLRGLSPSDRTCEQVSPTRRLLQLYILGFLLYTLQPFDVSIRTDEISRQFNDQINLKSGKSIQGRIVGQDQRFVRIAVDDGSAIQTVPRASISRFIPRKVILKPFSHPYRNAFDLAWQVGTDALLFIPFGMLFRYRRGVRQSMLRVLLLSLAVAATIEVAQLFVLSRFLDTTDVFSSCIGAVIGAWLAGILAIGQPNPNARESEDHSTGILLAAALCLVYLLPLMAIMWQPYKLVDSAAMFWKQLGMMIDVPFKAYYYAGESKALSNLMRNLMLFLPVGALIRWGFGMSQRGLVAKQLLVVGIAMVMGLILEVGKSAMVAKHADVTDLMIYVAGALAGWWIWGTITRPTPDAAR